MIVALDPLKFRWGVGGHCREPYAGPVVERLEAKPQVPDIHLIISAKTIHIHMYNHVWKTHTQSLPH